MRLLSLESDGDFSLVEYVGNNIPRYAILSHTWGADREEVTFQDLIDGTGKGKAGYRKLVFCGKQAAKDGLQFFWVDTCCIDKRSSSELSEAINSMFEWYKKSRVCYAYLEDVHLTDDTDLSKIDKSVLSRTTFANAKWFRRGWTLQELIAPEKVIFYSRDWKILGTKSSLSPQISQITGIDRTVLDDTVNLHDVSKARLMSWASYRKTTRVEDEAYCLLGIFSVNMPLLYGEGRRAFVRLQEEIMKDSSDHSLFAWTPDFLASRWTLFGAFANSAFSFAHSSNIVPFGAEKHSYSLTNQGLSVRLPLVPEHSQHNSQSDIFIGILHCVRVGDDFGFVGIKLQALDKYNEIFGRTHHGLAFVSMEQLENARPRDIYITKRDLSQANAPIEKKFALTRKVPSATYNLRFEGIFTADREWNKRAENQLIDLSLVWAEKDSVLNLVGRMAVLYTHSDTCYAVVVECLVPWGSQYAGLVASNLASVEIRTFPRGDRRSIEERTRALVKSIEFISGQSSSNIEISGFGRMRASITLDRIKQQELWILDIDCSDTSAIVMDY